MSQVGIEEGVTIYVQGSGSKPYELKNVGGVYSCTCPAWRNQSVAIEQRTCKHLRKLRGDAAEEARVGGALPQKPVKEASAAGEGPPLLLAERWESDVDLAGWWMSEKLDGVSRHTGTASSSCRARATCITPPTGSSLACRMCRLMENCGSIVRSSSGP